MEFGLDRLIVVKFGAVEEFALVEAAVEVPSDRTSEVVRLAAVDVNARFHVVTVECLAAHGAETVQAMADVFAK